MKALITGASSGLGRAFAKELDKLGYELILVSRTPVKENYQNYKHISCDLLKKEDRERLFKATGCDIDLLINSAGTLSFGYFHKLDIDKELELLELNNKALIHLTHYYLKHNLNKKMHILNVSSLAAISYGPLMASYYASKAFVTSFSISLAKELKSLKSSVKVSILMPSSIDTAMIRNKGLKPISLMDPNKVARYALKKTFKSKLIIIPGFKEKLIYFLSKIIPISIMTHLNYLINKKKKGTI